MTMETMAVIEVFINFAIGCFFGQVACFLFDWFYEKE